MMLVWLVVLCALCMWNVTESDTPAEFWIGYFLLLAAVAAFIVELARILSQ